MRYNTSLTPSAAVERLFTVYLLLLGKQAQVTVHLRSCWCWKQMNVNCERRRTTQRVSWHFTLSLNIDFVILILEIISYMILIWNHFENSDFDVDFIILNHFFSMICILILNHFKMISPTLHTNTLEAWVSEWVGFKGTSTQFRSLAPSLTRKAGALEA